MGAVLAKFRKEKTTYEILEKLETDIKKIEEYSVTTQSRRKRFVGNFLVISIGLYVVCFLVFYFAFFPPTWPERLSYSVPLLIFPLIIFFLRRFLAWYFQRKLNGNSNKLSDLHARKKKILEKVMDNETYKVALKLLNRFGDKSSNIRTAAITPTVSLPSQVPSITPIKKFNSVKPQPQQTPIVPHSSHQQHNNLNTSLGPNRRIIPEPKPNSSGYTPQRQQVYRSSLTPNVNRNSPIGWRSDSPRTPFPIINQQGKGVVEKMVDYLIGDGPQNRMAMICKECYGHNGMALQEEFEYMTFRCAYCNCLNPSKKSRPIAPKLPSTSVTSLQPIMDLKRSNSSDSSSTSASEKFSGSDSEDEEVTTEKNTQEIVEKKESSENVEDIPVKQDEEKKLEDEIIDDAEKPELEKKTD